MPPKPNPEVNYGYLLPICLVAALGGLLFGYDTGVISGAIEPLTAKFGLGAAMKGWVSGCVLVGCALGVISVGGLSDRSGRRLPLFLSAGLFLISAGGTAAASGVWMFIVFRFLGGLGIGVASMATPMYIAEITPASVRGRLVAVNQIAVVCGIAATSFANYFIAGRGDQAWLIENGWRWMFATGIAPSVLFAALLLKIPESPRWLIEMKRDGEAEAVLTRVAGSAFCSVESAEIRAAITRDLSAKESIFSARLRRPLLIGLSLAVLQQVTGINVFMYFGATIFRSLSASTGVDSGLLQQVIINGSCVVFTLIAIASVDRWGRKPLMLLGAAGMGLALFAMGVLAQVEADPASAGGRMLAFIMVYIAAFGLSVGPVVWVILVEIFPTTVRGRALGLATFALWTSDYVVTQTFPMIDAQDSWLVSEFHHAFPFYLYAAFCVVLIGVVWRYLPETKGRSLEEIEQEWGSRDETGAVETLPGA